MWKFVYLDYIKSFHNMKFPRFKLKGNECDKWCEAAVPGGFSVKDFGIKDVKTQ